MSLRILMGDYGAGKTTMAKYLAKKVGGVYLDIELVTNLNTLVDMIKPDKCYFMDGWPKHYSYDVLVDALNTDIKMAVCMAAPENILERQKIKALWVSEKLPRVLPEIVEKIYLVASMALSYDDEPLFIDTTSQPPTFWDKRTWFRHWIEMCLYTQFKNRDEYQDIELDNYKVIGLSESYKTWDRLNSIIDFKGKSVCDYGCNYGYFSFKAEGAGASRVVGVDVSSSVINTAASIAIAKNSRVEFLTMDLQNYQPPITDIIMALNVLHHLNNTFKVVNSLFKSANMVVTEIPAKDLRLLALVADGNKYNVRVVVNSHREDRCIVIFSRNQKLSVPDKYLYKPHRARINKRLRYALIRLAHIFTFGHVGILRRIYLRRFR